MGQIPPTIHFEMREFIMPESINGAVDQPLVPPRHIAIIMDGNGRWATKRGLPRTAGHKAGAETFRRIATYCKNIGVKYLTVYAFSTENWKRSEMEVSAIMALLKRYLLEAVDTMEKDHIRLHFFGDMTPIAPDLRALARETDEITEHLSKDDFQANVCLNYGPAAPDTDPGLGPVLGHHAIAGGHVRHRRLGADARGGGREGQAPDPPDSDRRGGGAGVRVRGNVH